MVKDLKRIVKKVQKIKRRTFLWLNCERRDPVKKKKRSTASRLSLKGASSRAVTERKEDQRTQPLARNASTKRWKGIGSRVAIRSKVTKTQ